MYHLQKKIDKKPIVVDVRKVDNKMNEKCYIKPMNAENIAGFKRTRRYSRVRKRIKY